MACDGDIDPREVDLIKKLSNEKNLFGNINISSNLDSLLNEINEKGHLFLKEYLSVLKDANLTDKEQLQIITVSIDTINADDIVEYSEIKFFKLLKSKLSISNDKILETLPEIEEYLEEDIISDSFLSRLKTDFFAEFSLPKFEPLHKLDDDILNKLQNN